MKLHVYLPLLLSLTACDEGVNTQYSGSCSVDAPVRGAILQTSEDFVVWGWAYDDKTNTAPEHVGIQFNSVDGQVRKTFEATRSKRPDVNKVFNKLDIEMLGYGATVPKNSLVAGQYEVIVLQDMPEASLKCTKDILIEVTGQIMPTQQPKVDAVPVSMPVVATTASPILEKSVEITALKPVEAQVPKVKKQKLVKKETKPLLKDKVVN